MKAIVTDHSSATRMVLKEIMEELAFEVQVAEDGGQLLEALTRGMPDVCLIDWNMPGMTGAEVVRVMRSHPDWRHIPSILVTDETPEERIASAMAAGASGCLAQPYETAALRALLASVGLSCED